jgi:hypothetical protein
LIGAVLVTAVIVAVMAGVLIASNLHSHHNNAAAPPASPSAPPATTAGALAEPPAGSYIAVLASVPANAPVAVAQQRAQAAGQANVLDSRQWASLRDPYWVVYLGPFRTERAAKAACAARRLPLSACYPRRLTH